MPILQFDELAFTLLYAMSDDAIWFFCVFLDLTSHSTLSPHTT